MENRMKYEEFIKSKLSKIEDSGFNVDINLINPKLFDFQKHIVQIALKKGRYAIFADCGLGKTAMQLSWAHEVVMHTGKSVLILCPLAVSGQTINEGEKFNIKVRKYNNQTESGIYITNYEQLENISLDSFCGVVLDESSILKNFTGVYKNLIIDRFKTFEYKLACTATPSPNDMMEIGNHAEFLNVMSRNEMLSMYFVHDGGETSKWRLKGHCETLFYEWISSWAIMLTNPADIGFYQDDYILPKLNFINNIIKTIPKEDLLFNVGKINATDFNSELRITMVDRIEKVIEIVNNSNENFIIWTKHNEESDYLNKKIDGSFNVKGSDSAEHKESKLLGFSNNEFRVLITKTKIAQFGLNYQNCNNQVFASVDFSFESLYQAIRRSYRFGQKKEVNIFIITTDTMENVIENINKKQKIFEKMQKSLSVNLNLANKINKRYKSMEINGDKYRLILGDCVNEMDSIESESVGFSVFSPPFAELYVYSDNPYDMGNSKDYNEFLIAFNFMVKKLERIMIPGRNVAIHCMDLPIQKGKEGYIGLRDFSGMILQTMLENNFIYHSRVTIWKNPVTEMQRTKALGLLHKQVKKDSSMSRVGIPDYLLVFRKNGENPNPIANSIPVDVWQQYASPVWMDIDYSNTLNKNSAREEKDEKHICPLQLDTIERAIHLWSNENDVVFTPFMGIGSEIYQAVKMNRRGIGIELKESYFDIAVKNIESVSKEQSLFK
jgi:hypothetical protein